MQHRTSSPTTSGFWCDQIPQTGTHDNWMPGFPLCSDSSVLRPDGTFGQSSTTCSEKRARRGTLARSAAQGTSSHCGFALCIGVPYTPQFRWRLRSITRMPMRSPQPFCSRASLPTAARFLLSRSWPSGAGSQQRVKASSRSTISQALPRVRCNCFLRDLLRMVGMVSASRNRVRGVVFHLRDSSPGSWMENVS